MRCCIYALVLVDGITAECLFVTEPFVGTLSLTDGEIVVDSIVLYGPVVVVDSIVVVGPGVVVDRIAVGCHGVVVERIVVVAVVCWWHRISLSLPWLLLLCVA